MITMSAVLEVEVEPREPHIKNVRWIGAAKVPLFSSTTYMLLSFINKVQMPAFASTMFLHSAPTPIYDTP
jgi:hypothetical protein